MGEITSTTYLARYEMNRYDNLVGFVDRFGKKGKEDLFKGNVYGSRTIRNGRIPMWFRNVDQEVVDRLAEEIDTWILMGNHDKLTPEDSLESVSSQNLCVRERIAIKP